MLAITQAICDYRKQKGIDGPLFLGFDTHALSAPAFATAIEVLAANGVEVMTSAGDEYTPTPAVSHAILTYNRGRTRRLCGRHRHHALPQSSRQRRIQVQPARRRPRGHRSDRVDRSEGQCPDRIRPAPAWHGWTLPVRGARPRPTPTII